MRKIGAAVLKSQPRYAMLTVDVEALPRRASVRHVERLVWGKHPNGTAGMREVCEIGDDVGIKHVCFVDLCAAHSFVNEMLHVVDWLHRNGQDVQLHAHPEVLPKEFWRLHSLSPEPALMNEFREESRATFVIKHFGGMISQITGKAIQAFRAGSFRWNAATIRALRASNVPLSFNNSMRAFQSGRSVFADPTNYPFFWSNGVIEIPVTEKRVLPQPGGKESWASLTYPESPYFPFRTERTSLLKRGRSISPGFSVFLMHSWSLLHWGENGYAVYQSDERLEGYRKLLIRLAKDYDVITTQDFLDLRERGKIRINNTVDVDRAAYTK